MSGELTDVAGLRGKAVHWTIEGVSVVVLAPTEADLRMVSGKLRSDGKPKLERALVKKAVIFTEEVLRR